MCDQIVCDIHWRCVGKLTNTAQVFVELEHLARKCLAMGATPSYLTWSNDRLGMNMIINNSTIMFHIIA